jgi:amino acid transporter
MIGTQRPVVETGDSRGRLLRVLGVTFGLAVIIGNTIGGGIFRTPGSVAEHLPNVWLYLGVWIIGGLYALLGANSISELGTMLPQSGGQYVFARYALGEYAGFIVGWADWISTCGASAAVSIVVGEFVTALLPGTHSYLLPLFIAVSVATFFAVLQWRGINWGSRSQNITSLLKTLLLFALISAAFVMGGNGEFSGQATAPQPLHSFALIAAIVLSLQTVIYTYDGWTGVVYFSEEVQNPERSIPRSMMGGVLLVITIYLLVNLSLLYVLPISQIAGKDFAIGAAANIIFGRYGDTIFRLITIVSLLSTINACHLMASRVLFGMSRDGLFVRRAARVNSGGTPTFSLLLTAIVALLFIAFGQTFELLANIMAFFFVAMYTLSFLSVFVLRWREPERSRPYKAWGYPWTTGVALVGSIIFLIGAVASDPRTSFYAIALLIVSYPIFRLVRTKIVKSA